MRLFLWGQSDAVTPRCPRIRAFQARIRPGWTGDIERDFAVLNAALDRPIMTTIDAASKSNYIHTSF